MKDPTNKDKPAPPWGDDMESALIAQDKVLRSRVKAPSSPRAARRLPARIAFVICATALLGVLLTLLLISYSCNRAAIAQSNKHKPARLLPFERCDQEFENSGRCRLRL
jgi:hypothetical protein